MVRQLTRVDLAPAFPPRLAELADLLGGLGFHLRQDGASLVAESSAITAEEAQRRLRARGVHDGEYRLLVEYERAWGYL